MACEVTAASASDLPTCKQRLQELAAHRPATWLPRAVRPQYLSTRPATDDHVRRAGYWAVLAGAFGHTYGHNSIWQMYASGHKGVLEPTLYRHETPHAPSAQQMGYLRRLMESRPEGRGR